MTPTATLNEGDHVEILVRRNGVPYIKTWAVDKPCEQGYQEGYILGMFQMLMIDIKEDEIEFPFAS